MSQYARSAGLLIAAATAAALGTGRAAAAAEPAAGDGRAAVGSAAATETPRRSPQEVGREIGAVMGELRKALPTRVIYDPEKRAAAAAQAVPLLRREIALAQEFAGLEPARKSLAEGVVARDIPLLALLGEAEAKATLDAWCASGDRVEAQRGAAGRFLIRWWNAPEGGDARGALLDEAERLARADGDNEPLGRALMEAVRAPRILTAQRDRGMALLAEHLRGPTADGVRKDIAARGRLAAIEGKPLTIQGVRHDGKPFSTADLKGKVILVDFWATWCGPCVAELPRVKAAYAKYHDQGLEVLGVSCDEKAGDLADYLAKNPDMPWPQLFDAAKPGWHALADGYGIRGIPAMFLIDRKGVVRSVRARETFEQEIPKLLAEQAE